MFVNRKVFMNYINFIAKNRHKIVSPLGSKKGWDIVDLPGGYGPGGPPG